MTGATGQLKTQLWYENARYRRKEEKKQRRSCNKIKGPVELPLDPVI